MLSDMANSPLSPNSISCLYCWRSISSSMSLWSRNLKRIASSPIAQRSIPFAPSKLLPLAPFRLIDMTGNFPMYFSQSSFSFDISRPSKSVLSVPILKKYFSMLIVRVLPKRLGRVKRFTFPGISNSALISPVLST